MEGVVLLGEAAVKARTTPSKLFNALARGELTGRRVQRGNSQRFHWVVDGASLDHYIRAQAKLAKALR